jgi:copper chaperone CopZ
VSTQRVAESRQQAGGTACGCATSDSAYFGRARAAERPHVPAGNHKRTAPAREPRFLYAGVAGPLSLSDAAEHDQVIGSNKLQPGMIRNLPGVTVSENIPVSTMLSVVLEFDGVQWASEKNTVEATLGRRRGVVGVEANPVAQTATVTYEPARTTVEDLAGWIRGLRLSLPRGSVPDHICSPQAASAGESAGGMFSSQTPWSRWARHSRRGRNGRRSAQFG